MTYFDPLILRHLQELCLLGMELCEAYSVNVSLSLSLPIFYVLLSLAHRSCSSMHQLFNLRSGVDSPLRSDSLISRHGLRHDLSNLNGSPPHEDKLSCSVLSSIYRFLERRFSTC